MKLEQLEQIMEECKPGILKFYNLTKCGLDVLDEMKGSYSVSRMSNWWSMTIFYSLMNTAGINGYLILTTKVEKLHRKHNLKKLSFCLSNCEKTTRTAPLHLTVRSNR